jgi:hypothetical protein
MRVSNDCIFENTAEDIDEAVPARYLAIEKISESQTNEMLEHDRRFLS